MLYLDTSVVAALYLPEAKSEIIEKRLAKESACSISNLTEVEFASAISRRVRMDDISASDGQRIIARFASHIRDGHYPMISMGQQEYECARAWLSMFKAPLRTLDALHLALCRTNDLQLFTSDGHLARSAKALKVPCKLM